MKADLKTKAEIEAMRECGYKLSSVLERLIPFSTTGKTLLEIENLAQKLIAEEGGKAGFAMVPGYDWATCININDGIVHGIPNQYQLRPEDVVSIDIGMYYKGFHTDMSTTFQVEPQHNKEIDHFLQTGQKALEKAIAQVKPGNRIGHISQVIEDIVEGQGYSCSRNLTGHGVGRTLHEYPQIPCILVQDIDQTPLIKAGMTLAIEVIYAQGTYQNKTSKEDGWTISTADGKIAAVFEKTIAVTDDGYLILTP
ncbi:type I methionyl aminopeptidase [Candidatus Beckwithbacteria bacterium]|nr:type I methionyl aminopeptidase [Candidatus Beckwithbacteria bacterium]